MKQVDSQVKRHLYHSTFFCQSFSPCGKYLAAGNNYGVICVFSVSAALAPEATLQQMKPFYSFKAYDRNSAVFVLVSSETLLLSAGVGPICAWSWTDILNKAAKPLWSWKIPNAGPYTETEVNCLAINKKKESTIVMAGCGNNKIHTWDMDSGNPLTVLSEHTDYIHGLTIKDEGNLCASASEDGTVKIWDMRQPQFSQHTLEPFKNEECMRPEFGKWVGCVLMDKDSDWLVCGGGPVLGLWTLRSLDVVTAFNTPNSCQKTVIYYDDTIISAGSEPLVNHWYINGDKKCQVPCSPHHVYDVAVNTGHESYKVLTAAGNCPLIDVCTNFGYKAFSFCCDEVPVH